MEQRETVIVYSFQVYDVDLKAMRIANFKATRAAIEEHFAAEVLEGTGYEVSIVELDAHGRYRRIATGWGELA